MNESEKETWRTMVCGVIGLVLAVPLQIFEGFVFQRLWAWFVMGTFGAPRLSIPLSIGLVLTVRFATPTLDLPVVKRNAVERLGHMFGTALLAPGLLLGVGWIVHCCMS